MSSGLDGRWSLRALSEQVLTVFHACEAATGNDSSGSESLIYLTNLTLAHSRSSEMMLFLMLMSYRGMTDKRSRLEPGCSALYIWQNPMSERLLVWRCTDKNENFENELTKVHCMNLLISGKCPSYLSMSIVNVNVNVNSRFV